MEVEVEITTERPEYVETLREEQINLEAEVDEYQEDNFATEQITEIDDAELSREIELRQRELETQRKENNELRVRYDAL